VNGKQGLVVIDTRLCARRLFVKLTGNERRVYEACDRAVDMSAIMKAVGGEIAEKEIEAAARSLADRRLLLCIDGRYLNLATGIGPDRGRARKHRDEKMPGGHLRPMSPSDLLGAWRRRTGFRWVLSAYLHREMALGPLRCGHGLATRLLSGLVHGVALLAGRMPQTADARPGRHPTD
jgi:hypothetical protein